MRFRSHTDASGVCAHPVGRNRPDADRCNARADMWSNATMHHKSESLLENMDRSIALMAELRTPDPVTIAAFDALKQARALIARAFENERRQVPIDNRAAA